MSDPNGFTFVDLGHDEVWVGTRPVEGGVALTVSKKSDGDIDVTMPLDAVGRLAAVLRDSIRVPDQGPTERLDLGDVYGFVDKDWLFAWAKRLDVPWSEPGS